MNKNVPIYLIAIFSGIYLIIFIASHLNVGPHLNKSPILEVFTGIVFIISMSYILSITVLNENNNLRDKLKFIDGNQKKICIGVIIVFILLTCIPNNSINIVGHVELDEAKIGIGNNIYESGYWVYSATGKPTGEVEYDSSFSVGQNITINASKIKCNNSADSEKFNEALNNDNLSVIIKFYDDSGNYITEYSPKVEMNNSMIIINYTLKYNPLKLGFLQTISDFKNIKCGEVHIIIGNDVYGPHIVSNRFNDITVNIETVD